MTRILTVIATALMLFGLPATAQTSIGDGIICVTDKFALCTSAPCIPDPSAPTVSAICNCVMQTGTNYGTTPCANRIPKNVSGTETVISTYSFGQAAAKKVIACGEGSFWTDCLNKPCVIDPRDPSKAICTCDLKQGEAFVTYSDSCDQATCGTGYWSAATQEAFDIGSAALIRDIGYKNEPYAYCEAPE